MKPSSVTAKCPLQHHNYTSTLTSPNQAYYILWKFPHVTKQITSQDVRPTSTLVNKKDPGNSSSHPTVSAFPGMVLVCENWHFPKSGDNPGKGLSLADDINDYPFCKRKTGM